MQARDHIDGPADWSEVGSDSALERATGRTMYLCGFLYLLLSPFHQVLRFYTSISVIVAWKEILQGFGVAVLACHLIASRGKGSWNLIAIISLLVVAMCLPSMRAGILAQGTDAILLLIGPSIAGYFFYWEARRLYTEGVISPALRALFLGAVVASLWIMIGSRLGLERFVARVEEEEWALLREGIMRVPGTFDSPMSAGQYLWLMGTMAMAAALFVRRFLTSVVLFGVTVICFVAVLYTASRGPYIIVGGAAFFLVGAGLWTRSPGAGKKSGIIALTLASAVALTASMIDVQTLETYLRVFQSSVNNAEASNAERNTRIIEGVSATIKYLPNGRGLEWFPVRNLVGTGLIYENTYLGLGVALGIRGIFIGVLYALFLGGAFIVGLVNVFKRRAPASLMIALAGPWLAYSVMYPQLQARFSAMVSWCVIGASLGCYRCLREWNMRE